MAMKIMVTFLPLYTGLVTGLIFMNNTTSDSSLLSSYKTFSDSLINHNSRIIQTVISSTRLIESIHVSDSIDVSNSNTQTNNGTNISVTPTLSLPRSDVANSNHVDSSVKGDLTSVKNDIDSLYDVTSPTQSHIIMNTDQFSSFNTLLVRESSVNSTSVFPSDPVIFTRTSSHYLIEPDANMSSVDTSVSPSIFVTPSFSVLQSSVKSDFKHVVTSSFGVSQTSVKSNFQHVASSSFGVLETSVNSDSKQSSLNNDRLPESSSISSIREMVHSSSVFKFSSDIDVLISNYDPEISHKMNASQEVPTASSFSIHSSIPMTKTPEKTQLSKDIHISTSLISLSDVGVHSISTYPNMSSAVSTHLVGTKYNRKSSTVTESLPFISFSETDLSNVAKHILVSPSTDLLTPKPATFYASIQQSSSIVLSDASAVISTTIEKPVPAKTTAKPNIHIQKTYNFSFEVEFTGECKSLENKEALTEVWSSLINIVGQQSGPKRIIVEPINILCGPLRLAFNVYNSTRKNLTEVLQAMVGSDGFLITVLVDNYKLEFKATKIYTYIEHEIDADFFLMGLNEVDIIVIICATAISVVLVCAGLIICAREYYLKKRTRSFTLSSFMSNGSNSYDYTLQKMPRPNSLYSENGVRMKAMGDQDGQRAALLPIEEQETSVNDIHIRVNSNDTGIIVGVTGTGNSKPDDQQQSPVKSINDGDQSGERLCPSRDDLDKSVDNPIYFADDERFIKV